MVDQIKIFLMAYPWLLILIMWIISLIVIKIKYSAISVRGTSSSDPDGMGRANDEQINQLLSKNRSKYYIKSTIVFGLLLAVSIF